jgi:hypothetical protein
MQRLYRPRFRSKRQNATRIFAAFFGRNRWKPVAECILASCNRIRFPVCFLHESRFSRKHVLFPVLYGAGTGVFWRRGLTS